MSAPLPFDPALLEPLKLYFVGTPIQGPEGLSAYEVAVANGFQGTEAEWLESLNAAEVEMGVTTTHIVWRRVGEPTWRNLYAISNLQPQFRKNGPNVEWKIGTSNDWVPLLALDDIRGDDGWTPIFQVIEHGNRRVLRVSDWVGGTGTSPLIGGYVGPNGFTDDILEATDIRGPVGTGTGDMLGSNNLSELTDVATARSTLKVFSKTEGDSRYGRLDQANQWRPDNHNTFYSNNDTNSPVHMMNVDGSAGIRFTPQADFSFYDSGSWSLNSGNLKNMLLNDRAGTIPELTIKGDAARLLLNTDNKTRWALSDPGDSHLWLDRYNDQGEVVDHVLKFDRITGLTTVNGNLSVKAINASGDIRRGFTHISETILSFHDETDATNGYVSFEQNLTGASGAIVFRDANWQRQGLIYTKDNTLHINADVSTIRLNKRPVFDGNLAWDAGNFDPNTKANLESPSFTGTVSVNNNGVWHSGNLNPAEFVRKSGDTINGSLRVNTGSIQARASPTTDNKGIDITHNSVELKGDYVVLDFAATTAVDYTGRIAFNASDNSLNMTTTGWMTLSAASLRGTSPDGKQAGEILTVGGREQVMDKSLVFMSTGGFAGSGVTNHLEVRSDTVGGTALMSFHRQGAQGVFFGLNTAGNFAYGGWSEGNNVAYDFWTTKNLQHPVSRYDGGDGSIHAIDLGWDGTRVKARIDGGNAFSTLAVRGSDEQFRDILATRGDGTGVIRLGSHDTALYYNGTEYQFQSGKNVVLTSGGQLVLHNGHIYLSSTARLHIDGTVQGKTTVSTTAPTNYTGVLDGDIWIQV